MTNKLKQSKYLGATPYIYNLSLQWWIMIIRQKCNNSYTFKGKNKIYLSNKYLIIIYRQYNISLFYSMDISFLNTISV
jgi:hypothetical protein